MSIQKLSIADFSYHLPDEKIARYPLDKRDESKLLEFKNGGITDYHFHQLPQLLDKDSLLVYNNTKVIHARLLFQKTSGAQIEIFCLEPFNFDYKMAFHSKDQSVWNCMIGNKKKWKGEILERLVPIGSDIVTLKARLQENSHQNNSVAFTWNNPKVSFGEILFHAGLLPIPPYLKREAEEKDEELYQTYFAKMEGSVAAPTAGLHFTPQVMQKLKEVSVRTEELTLHVGAGTFLPVKASQMGEHEMHKESVIISRDAVQNIYNTLKSNRPLIAVGTTSMRSLESLFWHGVNVLNLQSAIGNMQVTQWQAYEMKEMADPIHVLEHLLDKMQKENLTEISGETQIIIGPGYSFKLVNGLVTNFHQPNSTLLLLVAALVGSNWKEIYTHALQNNYRFLSFGDSSLLWRN